MIEALLYLLIIRSIIHNIWTAIAINKLKKTLLAKEEIHTLSGEKKIFLILPVFREEKIIKESIEYIYNQIKDFRNVYLYIVGTARERSNPSQNQTLELAKSFVINSDKIKIIEDNRPSGWMAQQVNFAVNQIIAEGNNPKTSWTFLINIDSKFSRKGLNLLIENVNNEVQIIQQSAIFLSNFNRIHWLQKGFALWQSRWTITHEIKRLVLNRVNGYYLMHVVGHGLCINLDKFQEYKGFSEETPTEDLHIGYFLASGGEKARPLWILEMADSPASFIETIKQKYTWSFGPMFYPSYLFHFRRKLPDKWRANRFRAIAIMFQGITSFISWSLTSWILLFMIIASFYSPLAFVFIFLYLLEYFQCTLYFYYQGYIKLKDLLLIPIYIFASGVFHSLPANIALFNILFGFSKIRNFKTSHE